MNVKVFVLHDPPVEGEFILSNFSLYSDLMVAFVVPLYCDSVLEIIFFVLYTPVADCFCFYIYTRTFFF